VNEPQLIRRQQIRVKLEGTTASVTDRVFLENHSAKPLRVRLSLTARDPEGKEAASVAESFTLVPGSQEKSLTLRIDGVRRWHFDHPVVYRLEASLYRFGRRDVLESLDSIADNFGARTIEIRDRHLYLNGEPVRLSGMTRHEDSPWEGLAETRGTMKQDYEDMKQLQVTLTRPVHYPQNPYILDYCDRHGILLIPEIPMWQFSERQMSDPKVLALAEQMMREMIEQDFNHPSIFAWSVCNESATDTPGGRAYFQTMYETVKKLDPDRYVSYADDKISKGANPAINAASIADFVMMNEYFGSWHGPESGLAPALERVRREYPGKLVLISEFGFAGPFAPDKPSADRIRERIIREQMDAFGKFDFVGGAIFWCYQDYRSHRNLRPGRRSGYVEMGVVDENRQRNPSFYTWQERNAPAWIQVEWMPGAGGTSGFRATITPRRGDEIPHYTLRGYRAEFTVRDRSGKVIIEGQRALPDIGPAYQFEVALPKASSPDLTLEFRLLRPTGFSAAEFRGQARPRN
jgi:beta-galactosidase/beta-glucuronidase